MIFIVPIPYIIAVLIHAAADALRTKNDKPVRHWEGSVLYGAVCIILFYVFKAFWHVDTLPLILFPILTRTAFFDAAYNVFIGKNWLYEGVPKPRNKESLVDRIERWIGLPIAVLRILYLIIYLAYLFLYFLL